MTANPSFTSAQIGMFKLSWPWVRSVLTSHWRLILLLIIISVLLGFVPTIKSELEAGLIDQISVTIRERSSTRSPRPTNDPATTVVKPPQSFSESVVDVLSIRILRFARARPDEAVPEWLARLLFGQVGVGLALLVYLVLSVCAYAVDYLTTVLQTTISREVFAKLRGIGLTKGLVIDPSQLPALSNVAGQYSNAIQIGAANVGNTYGYLLDGGQYVLSLVTALVLVVSKSWQFAGACLVVILIQVGVSYVQGRKLRSERNTLDRNRNDLLARTDDVLSKREIILAYERQEHYRQTLERYTRDYADVVRTLDKKEKFYSLLSRLVTDYGRMCILLIGLLVTLGITRRTGSSAVSNIGDAYFFLSVYTRILYPASDLLRKYNAVKESESTSRTFLSVLRSAGSAADEESAEEKPSEAAPKPEQPDREVAEAVTFKRVYFRYPIDSSVDSTDQPEQTDSEAPGWVLNGVDLVIPNRKTTLVLGRSGCGKTTIARILLGFWAPAKGEVTVLGRPISEYSGYALRKQMAYVSQGDHIIDDSVRDNLSWGYTRDGKGISDERMIQVLLDLKVADTPVKAKALLDRKARFLSGGQQQRLSFARMMLDESEIMILDEPFAGVDIFTINEVREHLTRIFASADRTVLMFSHRLLFAAFADHVAIFSKDGKISDQDSPGALLRRGGEFKKLYDGAREELILFEKGP